MIKNIKKTYRNYKVRLSPEQFKYMQDMEKKSKLTRREFFLSLISCNHLTIKQIDTKELYSAISRIGNNINQIAIRANQNETLDKSDYEAIKKGLSDILALLRELKTNTLVKQ